MIIAANTTGSMYTSFWGEGLTTNENFKLFTFLLNPWFSFLQIRVLVLCMQLPELSENFPTTLEKIPLTDTFPVTTICDF